MQHNLSQNAVGRTMLALCAKHFQKPILVAFFLIFLAGILKPASAEAIETFSSMQSPAQVSISDSHTQVRAESASFGDQLIFIPLNTLLEQFVEAKHRVKILIVILFLLIIGLILLFIYIFVNRTRKTAKWSWEEKTRNLYQTDLTNFLYNDENQPFEFTGLDKASSRAILIDELLWLHRNLLGESRIKIQDLYFNLQLYNDSKSKLNSPIWSIQAKGFRELAQAGVKDAANLIEKFTHSKNKILRIEAQLAMVKLKPENPLDFLKDLSYPLTEWEQINILNAMEAHNISINSFEEWMDNKNETVACFAIKMCGMFNHIQSWPKVLELLDHESADIRFHAINTLAKFNLPENKEPLKLCFWKQKEDTQVKSKTFLSRKLIRNKLAILEALSNLVSAEDAAFFTEVLKAPDEDFYVLKRAYMQLMQIDPAMSIEPTNTVSLQVLKLIDHYHPKNIAS